MRSKNTMNESAVMPIATMSPAMPGSVSVNPTALPSSSTATYVDDRRDEQRSDRDQSESAVVEQQVDRTTRIMPTRPAIRPAFSWLPARDGPSSETPLRPNVSGSAPYLSWLARSLDDVGGEVAGDLRRPSMLWNCDGRRAEGLAIEDDREAAARSLPAWVCAKSCSVILSNAFLPSPLSASATTHWTCCCGIMASALLTWVPSITVGLRICTSPVLGHRSRAACWRRR